MKAQPSLFFCKGKAKVADLQVFIKERRDHFQLGKWSHMRQRRDEMGGLFVGDEVA